MYCVPDAQNLFCLIGFASVVYILCGIVIAVHTSGHSLHSLPSKYMHQFCKEVLLLDRAHLELRRVHYKPLLRIFFPHFTKDLRTRALRALPQFCSLLKLLC